MADTPKDPAASKAKASEKPTAVRLTHPHGFIENDTQRHRFWKAGEMITDQAEIDLLMERGAPLEFVD